MNLTLEKKKILGYMLNNIDEASEHLLKLIGLETNRIES